MLGSCKRRLMHAELGLRLTVDIAEVVQMSVVAMG
jgi:hypothetical protein